MSLLATIQPIIMMVSIVGLGYFVSKNIEITKSIREFIAFIIINIAFPSVIIHSIFQAETDERTWVHIGLIFSSGLIMGIMALLTGFLTGRLFKYNISESKQMAVLSAFGNTSFYGIPVAVMLFGSTAGLYAAVYDASTFLSVFTLGIILLDNQKFTLSSLKKIINPPTMALVGSLSFIYFGLTLPSIILEITSILSSLAAPLAMMYIGMLFQEITSQKIEKLKNNYIPFIIFSVGIKMVFLPTIAILLVIFSGIDISIGKIMIVQAGMPTFLLATVLITRYTGSGDLGLFHTIITTLISIITLPLIILLVIGNL